MIVGIDVHKHARAAALIDERGGLIDAPSIANSAKGYRQLIDWLVDRPAAGAVMAWKAPAATDAASSRRWPAPTLKSSR